MATMHHLTRDRVGDTDFFVQLCRAADRIITPKPPLTAVWTLDRHGRLACHWEFDLAGRFVLSG
jgi:hypothetical protein